jgi:hypothetical protein
MGCEVPAYSDQSIHRVLGTAMDHAAVPLDRGPRGQPPETRSMFRLIDRINQCDAGAAFAAWKNAC